MRPFSTTPRRDTATGRGGSSDGPVWRRIALVASFALALVAGCGGESSSEDGCNEGRSTECTCATGETGAQVCQPDGTWGPCECKDPGPGDSGGIADADGSGSEDTGGAPEDLSDGTGDAGADSSSSTPARCCQFENLDTAESVSCRGMQFDRIVDAVDDLGADPDGNDRIDAILENEISDGTLVVFPEGTYLSGDVQLEGSDIGLIAAPGARPTVVPAEPRNDMGEVLWSYSDQGGFLLQGFEYDYTADEYGNRIQVTPSGDFSVCDIRFRGAFPDDTKGFRLDVRDENAEGLLQRAVMTGGPEETTDDWNGIYVGREHSGTVTIKECTVANGSNNGVYASGPGGEGGGDGPVRVIGGLYKNNNITGVRIGSTDSVVRDVDVVVDSQVPEYNGRNARGIRIRDKRGQVVEDCDIRYGEDATGGSGAVSVHTETGHATIRDVRIQMDKDGMAAIRGKSPEVGGDVGVSVENVHITGSAADEAAVDIADRPDSQIRNSCINQTGSNRDGVDLSRSGGSVVADTDIEVTGTQVDGSNVSTSKIGDTADCEAPQIDP